MDALFNVICFTLSVAIIVAGALSVLQYARVRKHMEESEAALLFNQAQNGLGTSDTDAYKGQVKELTGLAAQLADAGVSLSPKIWRVMQIGCSIAAGLVVYLLGSTASNQGVGMCIVLSVIACAGVMLGFRKFLESRAKRRMLLFEKQLAQIELQIAENSRSGLAISRSVMACSDLADEPLKGHLKRLYNEITYSDLTLAEGFTNMAKRTGSADARLLANVIAVQQQTGSNLADAMDFLNETISRRLEMRQTLRSALAETKITRTIVAITPWAIFALLAFVPLIKIEGFWEFYSTNPLGWAVLGACIVIEGIILVLISRMADLELD